MPISLGLCDKCTIKRTTLPTLWEVGAQEMPAK